MVDPQALRRWRFRAIFAITALAVLFAGILPVSLGRGVVPAPDLMVLLTFAWVLRRPDVVPVWLIAAVFLAADILFMRPLGLWTALVVLGSEFLRLRGSLTRSELTFPAEWMMVAAVLAAMTLAETLILAVVMVPQAGLGPTLLQLVLSSALYPVAVAVTLHVFGVRPMTALERDAARMRA